MKNNKPYPLYKVDEIHTLKDMIKYRTEKYPDSIAFSFIKGKNGIKKKSSREFSDDITALGTYLLSCGFKNDNIAIIGSNSYEWMVSFFAVSAGGNIAVPIDREFSQEKTERIIKRGGCKAIIASAEILKKLTEVSIPVYSMNDFPDYISQGRKMFEEGDKRFTECEIHPDDHAAIFFTSGTTGKSKGVVLTHENIMYNVCASRKNVEIEGNILSVLPYHHAFGLIIGVFSVYCYGCSVHINKSLKRITDDMKASSPFAVALVPLFVETFYKQIIANAKKSNKYKKLMLAVKFSDIAVKAGINIQRYLFKDIHEVFGGNLKYIICGGAAIDEKYIKFFRSFGINILNGYGITECSPVIAVNRNNYWREGSVGQVINECNVKIADDGEILVKGKNVMAGYYNDPESTEQVLNNGWYSTGDLGSVDKDGFLFITGRKKNLIILSNGENISPEEIEADILSDESVAEAVVYQKDSMLAVQIFPSSEYAGNLKHFEELIEKINYNKPMYRQINCVELRDTEFPKNSAKKIMRHKI